jgi:hydroxymethylpyrimidine/phosphomethylpyrimidine kinase
MTATTALTAQNTLGVHDIHHTPPAFLKKQIDAVCEDVGVDVIKTGIARYPGRVIVMLMLCRYAGFCRIDRSSCRCVQAVQCHHECG